MSEVANTRILRKRAVLDRTGLSDTTIWRLERRGEFPAGIRLSAGAKGWLERDVDHWIEERANQRTA